MKIEHLLLEFYGNYSTLFTSERGNLKYGKNGWELSREPLTVKTRKEYFTHLIESLLKEDLSKVTNVEALIYRINEVWHKNAKLTTKPGPTIYFNSKHLESYWLSNFFSTLIYLHGRLYTSAEIAYQTKKLEFLGANTEKIDDLNSGKAKQIGKKIQNKWMKDASRNFSSDEIEKLNETKLYIMRIVIQEKFTQNPHLKEALRATEQRNLVEETPDEFWGHGPDGKGSNHLGKIIEIQRQYL